MRELPPPPHFFTHPSHSLYKMLLLYEEGGHFKKHRDTEKEANMFGTLVVALPSQHEGGDLVITHCGKEVRFVTGGSDSGDWATSDSKWLRFMNDDCEHVFGAHHGWHPGRARLQFGHWWASERVRWVRMCPQRRSRWGRSRRR